MESWLPLEEFPGFIISNEGRVKNTKTGKIRKLTHYKTTVPLTTVDGRSTTRRVDKLIEQTFGTFKAPKE